MAGRKAFHLVFSIILILAYVLIYLKLMPLDSMQYISLLFSTIAITLLYNIPIVYPKRGKGYGKMTFKLYLVTILYALIVLSVSYIYSFMYTLDGTQKLFGMPLDDKFYFIAHTIGLAIEMLLIFLNLATPRNKIDNQSSNENDLIIEGEPINESEDKENY